jgi:hypothetical protein
MPSSAGPSGCANALLLRVLQLPPKNPAGLLLALSCLLLLHGLLGLMLPP